MFSKACFALLLALAWKQSEAKPQFRDLIPNGRNVPDPCNPGGPWQAVGHLAPDHGGKNFFNGFAYTFKTHWNNIGWNKIICKADSDGDGLSNGVELGDPSCVWSPGARPALTSKISHPGICEPLNDPTCFLRNKVFNFTVFNCPKLATLMGVINKIPTSTTVPPAVGHNTPQKPVVVRKTTIPSTTKTTTTTAAPTTESAGSGTTVEDLPSNDGATEAPLL